MRTIGILGAIALFISGNAWALTVHEWGTFTSFVASDGVTQTGLHHEEEPLPNFVYDLSRIVGFNPLPGTFPPTRSVTPPSMERMPIPTFTEEVTQKMETPVLYFHTDTEQDVTVRVDFPKGVISQWFPATSSQNAVANIRNGHATWKIKVLADTAGDLPTTSADSIWNAAREVKANTIEVNGEQERFIFYRGLAKFEVPLSYQITNESIKVSNNSAQTIENAYILKFAAGEGRIVAVGSIPANGMKDISLVQLMQSPSPSLNAFLDVASDTIAAGLVADGLFADEARAMVNTWKHSYFATEGLRMLYVLPSEWTEELLPITINPAPSSLVRTLVGRVEILTPAEEANLVSYAEANLQNPDSLTRFEINGRSMAGLGHFPEPKMRRILQLTADAKVKQSLNDLIVRMNRGLLFR